ncbi:PH domain-containing protein [Billgrantia endophytica]|uniref:Uncharacterized protein YyaB-like PH domain-containing protein n=1 Tax=Billgrantia endophytica TaxID=2033802 RepID=A0A2N7U5W0_9GAMM|nr:hypothetical protein C1H69_08580 [Halomonas endophytica]
MEKIYTSKIDAWLGVVLIGAVIACIFAFLLSLRSGNTAATLVTLPVLIIGAGLPLWLMMNTSYTLGDTTLSVRSGPFRWSVPIKDITGITSTSSPLSSPALSLDRLRIAYGRRRSIMISPKLKDQFIKELEARRMQNG